MASQAKPGERRAAAGVPGRPLAFVYGPREVIWAGIGHRLFATTGVIRDTLMRCNRIIRQRMGWSLTRGLLASKFAAEHIIEPSLTALQIALTEGWRERGVVPDIIAGCCGGEFAAEYARGTLSLEDAIEVACRIACILRDHQGAGRALIIEVGLSEAESLKRSCPFEFFIGADTEEHRTFITCETTSLPGIIEFLDRKGIAHILSRLGTAFHSPVIEAWRDQITKPLHDRKPNPDIPYYCAATPGRDEYGPYLQRLWRTLREPAIFAPMARSLIQDGCATFLEIGGQPLLLEKFQRAAAGRQVIVLPSMRRNEPVEVVMDETQDNLRQLAVPDRALAFVR